MKYQVAALKRWNAPVYGFRVCEAHHDGTPHWHLLLFMRPEDRNRVIGILQRYALTDDHDELVRDIKGTPPFTDFTPRFDWKEIDPAKGDAAGYIAKYIAKNIDGAYLDDDEEAGTAADEGALHAVAWASWWGIRTFQQIGGAPVDVWRELRRISNAKKHADLLGPPHRGAGQQLWRRHQAPDGHYFRSPWHQDPPARVGDCACRYP
ncbi:replication endonuclease [Aeromonas veronii]|uniref:replication endonuclease n=1 Tax=Aeromonas veronii TaxID=654 RepID=UPI003D15A8E2